VVNEEIKSLSFFRKFVNVFRIWGLEIVISLFLSFVLSSLLSLAKYDQSQHAINQFLDSNNVLILFLFSTIYAPIVEELTFRLFLKFSPFRFGLALAFFGVFLLQTLEELGLINITNLFSYVGISNTILIFVLLFVFAILSGILIGIAIKLLNIQSIFEKAFSKAFPIIFYLSAFIFGFAHISNYDGLNSIWFLIPFLGMPQIFIGTALGYVRVNYGLGWSMLLHALHNGLAMFALVLLAIGPHTMKFLTDSSTSFTTEQMTSSFTSLDYIAILLALLYFLLLIVVVLGIWFQALYEVYKEGQRS
jgi:membrane protease YdiL (CAAX protease family)